MGEVALVALPHPVGQLSADEAIPLFEQSFGEIEFILTAPAADVADAYRDNMTGRTQYTQGTSDAARTSRTA